MAFSHDITFCAGELVDCPKKESCYRYKEVDRFQPGEVFSMATLYKAACCEVNDFQLFIKCRLLIYLAYIMCLVFMIRLFLFDYN